VTIPLALALAAWATWAMPDTWLAPVTCVLGWSLLFLASVDVLALRLPDAVTFPLTAAGILVSAFLPEREVAGHLAGAAAGFLFLALVAWLYKRVRGHDGLGLGDAKLLAAAGAWLGWQGLPSVVLLGCGVGFAWVFAQVALKGREGLSARIPFGVGLAAAIWIVWLYGPLGMTA
jgi:leader peptidase (prepilin peptidase)/N-methyltransferase